MDATRAYLFAGEQVALMVRPHAIVLLKPFLPVLAAISLMAAFPNEITVVLFLIMCTRFGWDVLSWWEDRYVLTTGRVLSLSGILTKKIVSLPLVKITDLTYSKPLIGRILGYGTLNLESAGQQDFGEVRFLPDPDHFYRSVMSLALGPRPGGTPSDQPGEEPLDVEQVNLDESGEEDLTTEVATRDADSRVND